MGKAPSDVTPAKILVPGGPALVPHPLMLQVAELDGTLKPEFQEYADQVDLEPGTLDPVWWPSRVEGNDLTPAERHADFVMSLDETYRRLKKFARDAPTGVSDSPAKPERVLRALLVLRAAALQ